MEKILDSGLLFYVIITLGSIFSLIFCINRAKGFSVRNLMLKIASSLCFILTGVAALLCNPKNYVYAGFIIFGAALGMCGDITLDLKGIHNENKDGYMLSGFVFFLIGHVFYSAGIIYATAMKVYIILICLAACVAFSFLNLLSVKITKYDFGKFKLITFLYTIFLALTTALSIAAMITTHFEKQYVILAIGAVLFMLSDLILSGTYFGEGQDKPVHYFTNHLAYYAAQYFIVASIFFTK
ncbi:MAG: hypothetical protein IJT65_05560 [Eubacterium sp.]|nr:hypothetical protein [Eubacterium sp.]